MDAMSVGAASSSNYSRFKSDTNPSLSTTANGRGLKKSSILSERVIEQEYRVPKKIVTEEIVEKTVVVPEKVLKEEVVEEVKVVRNRIIEVAKPIIHEQIVNVPEVEYVEKIVEVPEVVIQEKIRRVPKIEYRERIVEVPKIIYQEKVVEVPEREYREIIVEKIVEVPEVHEEIVIKEVMVPQYVEKPVPEFVTVEVPVDVERNIPLPISAETTFEFVLPRLEAKYKIVNVPVYAPRFIEVPIPAELLDEETAQQADHLSTQIRCLAAQEAPSLCEIEKLAEFAKDADFQSHIDQENIQSAISLALNRGGLNGALHEQYHDQVTTTSTTQASKNPTTTVVGSPRLSNKAAVSSGPGKLGSPMATSSKGGIV